MRIAVVNVGDVRPVISSTTQEAAIIVAHKSTHNNVTWISRGWEELLKMERGISKNDFEKKWEGTEVKLFSERNVDFSIQKQALVNLSAGVETGSSRKQGKNMFKLEFTQIW